MLTSEQLLIYLYGIYPDGAITKIVSVIAIVGIPLILFIITVIVEHNSDEEVKNKYISKLFNISKKVYIAIAVILTVGYFIPPKNVFFAMIAAPYIKESLIDKDGKLNRIDEVIDKALGRAEKLLEGKENE